MDDRKLDQLADDIGIDLDAPVGSENPSRIEAAEQRIQRSEDAGTDGGPPEPIRLSDGRMVTFTKAKGRDLRKAVMICAISGSGGSQFEVLMGLVAVVAKIDDKRIAYEDLDEMPAVDVLSLVGSVLGNGGSLVPGI